MSLRRFFTQVTTRSTRKNADRGEVILEQNTPAPKTSSAASTSKKNEGSSRCVRDDQEGNSTRPDSTSAAPKAKLKVVCKFNDRCELDLQQLCTKLIKEKSEEFPDFAILANISLVVPLTSVPCERGFSVQNNIVNTKRSRMNVGNLNNKMLLVSEKRQADLTEDAVRELCNSAKRLKRC